MRFVKSTTAQSKRAPKKASRSAVSRTVVKPKTASSRSKATFKAEKTEIGWGDLVTSNDKKKSAHPEAESFLNTLSTARFAAVLLSILTLFTLYVGHVLTSQELLKNVQTLRRENQTLTLRLNQLQAAEDEIEGPNTIFDRAKALGLEERIPQGNRIIVY